MPAVPERVALVRRYRRSVLLERSSSGWHALGEPSNPDRSCRKRPSPSNPRRSSYTPAERARLAERLLASLDADPEIEAAWDDEIKRRPLAGGAGSGPRTTRGEVRVTLLDPADVSSAALELPPEQRAQLAQQQLASLDRDPEIEAAWDEEIRRRVADVEAGASETIPAEEVFAEARRRLKT